MKRVSLFVFVLIGIFSCTQEPRDHSLPVDAYIALGLPDPAKHWDMTDYTQAHNVLTKLKWERPLELPVRDSEKSGAVFARMVSLEYLSFLQGRTLTLNEKAARISEFVRVYDYWVDVYTVPMLPKNPYHHELMDIQIFNLKLMEAMLNLAQQINDSDDPADVALQLGYASIKENYFVCLDHNLKTQRDEAFPQSDRERMADSVYSSVLRNKTWMDSSSLNELSRSLRLVIDSTASEYIRQKYIRLEEFLEGT